MSSIVKAKLITEAHKILENKKMGFRTVQQNIELDNQMQFDEKKEEILRQTIKKSRQIENEAMKRADDLINNATINSREITVNAEQKGYEEGYLRGLVDGANASCTAAEESLDGIKKLIELIKTEKQEAVRREEKHLLDISFELAKKIMKQAIHLDESIVEKMLEEIVTESEGPITISLSEYQKTIDLRVDKSLAKKIRAFSKESKVLFVKEEDVIMVETGNGIIDMSIPTQIEHLKNALGNRG